MHNKYYSQFGQDNFLNDHFFKNKSNGFFIEAGAFDGVFLSNTYYFEKNLGWDGICVEPIPSRFNQLVENRKSRCIHGCLSATRGAKPFLYIIGGDKYDVMEDGEYPKIRGKEHTEMLSGLMDSYHPKHMQLVDKELAELGGNKEIILVPCYTFSDIVNGRKNIDYLSLDTEGNELEILKTINFDVVNINVISVEVLYPDVLIQDYLKNKGYKLIKICEYDHIYLKK